VLKLTVTSGAGTLPDALAAVTTVISSVPPSAGKSQLFGVRKIAAVAGAAAACVVTTGVAAVGAVPVQAAVRHARPPISAGADCNSERDLLWRLMSPPSAKARITDESAQSRHRDP
jgi:hypothetical protein